MQAKPITQSRTIWGALAMMIAFLLGQFGVEASLEELDAALANVAQAIELVTGIIGFVLVIWGRIKATRPVKLPKISG